MFGWLFKKKEIEVELPTVFIGYREQQFIKEVASVSGESEDLVRIAFRLGKITMDMKDKE